jgi:hypothetical protein
MNQAYSMLNLERRQNDNHKSRYGYTYGQCGKYFFKKWL